MRQNKIKSIILASACGILLVLSFPRLNLWVLAWFGFLPLLFAIRDKGPFKAFLLSYISGIIFFSGTIYWLTQVTFAGTVALILYLSLYFGAFGLIISVFSRKLSIFNLLFIPSVWVILEYLRSQLLTGFGWALLGYSQYLNLPVIQIADTTGVYGVSFLVMMVNAAIYLFIANRQLFISKMQNYLLPVSCMLVALTYGYYKIYNLPLTASHPPLKVSVVQGNIPQELKWDVQAQDYIINRYLSLTAQALQDKPDLIIWPEATLPFVLGEEPLYYQRVKNFVKEINTPLLLGAVRSEGDLYYNSALLISKEAQISNLYDKLHLVPFGEYIPLKNMLRFLETVVPIGDFTPGKKYTLFETQNSKLKTQKSFGVLICFEDIFPEISRQFVKKGAVFLVNITNDAWFGKTSSPYQHLQASVFRAVENRVFLVRAANTGISGFIDPRGKIVSKVSDRGGEQIFISGYRTQEVSGSGKMTVYTRYGDMFVLSICLTTLYGIIKKINYRMMLIQRKVSNGKG